MMVVYHVGYDVNLFGPSVDIDPFSGGWRALQLACGSTFLFVVGREPGDLERPRPRARPHRLAALPPPPAPRRRGRRRRAAGDRW